MTGTGGHDFVGCTIIKTAQLHPWLRSAMIGIPQPPSCLHPAHVLPCSCVLQHPGPCHTSCTKPDPCLRWRKKHSSIQKRSHCSLVGGQGAFRETQILQTDRQAGRLLLASTAPKNQPPAPCFPHSKHRSALNQEDLKPPAPGQSQQLQAQTNISAVQIYAPGIISAPPAWQRILLP